MEDSELLVGTVAALALSSDEDGASEADTSEEVDIGDEGVQDSEEALTSDMSQPSQSSGEGRGEDESVKEKDSTTNTNLTKVILFPSYRNPRCFHS